MVSLLNQLLASLVLLTLIVPNLSDQSAGESNNLPQFNQLNIAKYQNEQALEDKTKVVTKKIDEDYAMAQNKYNSAVDAVINEFNENIKSVVDKRNQMTNGITWEQWNMLRQEFCTQFKLSLDASHQLDLTYENGLKELYLIDKKSALNNIITAIKQRENSQNCDYDTIFFSMKTYTRAVEEYRERLFVHYREIGSAYLNRLEILKPSLRENLMFIENEINQLKEIISKPKCAQELLYLLENFVYSRKPTNSHINSFLKMLLKSKFPINYLCTVRAQETIHLRELPEQSSEQRIRNIGQRLAGNPAGNLHFCVDTTRGDVSPRPLAGAPSPTHLSSKNFGLRVNESMTDSLKHLMRYISQEDANQEGTSGKSSEEEEPKNIIQSNSGFQKNNNEENVETIKNQDPTTPLINSFYNRGLLKRNNEKYYETVENQHTLVPVKKLFPSLPIQSQQTSEPSRKPFPSLPIHKSGVFDRTLSHISEKENSKNDYFEIAFPGLSLNFAVRSNQAQEPAILFYGLIFGFIFISGFMFMGIIVIFLRRNQSFKTNYQGHILAAPQKNLIVDEKSSMMKSSKDSEMNGFYNSAYENYAKV